MMELVDMAVLDAVALTGVRVRISFSVPFLIYYEENILSEQYISYGVIAKLKQEVEDFDSFQVLLYKKDEEKLNISYDCTLAYMNYYYDFSYEFSIKLLSKNFIESMKQTFKEKLEEYNLEVDEESMKIFFNHHYSGSDNPIDEITLKEFEEIV